MSIEMNPPIKMGPVLKPERPWEREWCGAYISVLEDQGVYRMWYGANGEDYKSRLCYATSLDGLHWERPELGLVEYEGSRSNNLVSDSSWEGAVTLDPIAPPESRFKALKYEGLPGDTRFAGMMVLATSPDGMHWDAEYPALPGISDTTSQLLWDERLGKYVAYLRGYPRTTLERCVVRCEIPRDDILMPWPYARTEDQLFIGSYPRISTDNVPAVIARDDRDPVHCSVYTPSVHHYPWADNVYLAFPSFFRHTDPDEVKRRAEVGLAPQDPFREDRRDVPMSGIMEVQLTGSRDGICWERPDRRPYLPRGTVESTDSQLVFMGQGMLRRGSEIYMYYAGMASPHEAPHYEDNALMLAVQRLDGFVSVEANHEGGEFTTPPLTFSGDNLQINVESSALGDVSVEVLDENRRPIPGYSALECDPILANDVALTVSWAGSEQLPRLDGSAICLRFKMRSAKLYAFQFV